MKILRTVDHSEEVRQKKKKEKTQAHHSIVTTDFLPLNLAKQQNAKSSSVAFSDAMNAENNMVVEHMAPISPYRRSNPGSHTIAPSESTIPDFTASSSAESTASPSATPATAEPVASAPSSAREAYFKRAQQAVAARTAAATVLEGTSDDASSAAATPQLGELAIESMGSVDPRPAYHTQREIWPVGFSGIGTFCLAPGVQEQYRCEVIDGGNVPIFRVTFLPEGLGHTSASVGASSHSAALSSISSQEQSWEDGTPGGAWAQAMAARRLDHSAWHTTAGAMAAVAQHALDPGGEDEEEANLLKEVHAALSRKQTLQNALGRVATSGYGQKASGAHGYSSAAAMQALLASDNNYLPVGSAETGGLVLPKTSAFLGATAGATVEALPGALHCNNYLFREERTQRVAAAHRKASLAVAAAAMGPATSSSKSGESGGGGSGKRKRRKRGSGAAGSSSGGGAAGASAASIKEKNALKEAERLRIRDAELTALADSKLELKRQREQEREEKKTLQQEDKEARKRARENDRELAKQMKEEDKVRREKGRDAEKVARLLRKEVADAVSDAVRRYT